MTEPKRQARCDHCGQRVLVKGTLEPVYVHEHGSVFCMTQYAEVRGERSPA